MCLHTHCLDCNYQWCTYYHRYNLTSPHQHNHLTSKTMAYIKAEVCKGFHHQDNRHQWYKHLSPRKSTNCQHNYIRLQTYNLMQIYNRFQLVLLYPSIPDPYNLLIHLHLRRQMLHNPQDLPPYPANNHLDPSWDHNCPERGAA